MIRYKDSTILANITAHILFNGTSYEISAISAVKGAAAPWITIVLLPSELYCFWLEQPGYEKNTKRRCCGKNNPEFLQVLDS